MQLWAQLSWSGRCLLWGQMQGARALQQWAQQQLLMQSVGAGGHLPLPVLQAPPPRFY